MGVRRVKKMNAAGGKKGAIRCARFCLPAPGNLKCFLPFCLIRQRGALGKPQRSQFCEQFAGALKRCRFPVHDLSGLLGRPRTDDYLATDQV
jgi:hypothetical protein